jgi:hypothetical protein
MKRKPRVLALARLEHRRVVQDKLDVSNETKHSKTSQVAA